MNLQHLISPKGRLDRRGFLILAGAMLAVGVVVGLVPGIGGLLPLVFAWPWLCIAIKRLHDMGRSGIAAVVLMAINVALALVAMIASTMAMGLGLAALPLLAALGGIATIALVASLAFTAWLAFAPSQDGANRFGPPAPTFSIA